MKALTSYPPRLTGQGEDALCICLHVYVSCFKPCNLLKVTLFKAECVQVKFTTFAISFVKANNGIVTQN